ncbi:hypothetical protein WDV76_02950 [Xenorhabdus griffiniae]|uniref:hypothetical protein n=1 Tax=Xenorhabdus griffiniae TaxID=351672 RepID=UPI0030D3F850
MNAERFFEGLVAHGFVSEYRLNGVISLQCHIPYPPVQAINRALNDSLTQPNINYYLVLLGFRLRGRSGNVGSQYSTYTLCPHTINITINRYRREILPDLSTSTPGSSRFCERVKQLADYTQRAHTEQIYGAAINSLDYPTKNTLVEQSVLNWVMHGYPPTR